MSEEEVKLSDAKRLMNRLGSLKNRSIDLYETALDIGFEDAGTTDDSAYSRVAPEIGNVMCQIDQAIGELNSYLSEKKKEMK